MITHHRIIATRLVKNNIVLPDATSQFINQIQIPITHSGGTNDAAIATPAKPAAIFLNQKAKNAINPDAKAIQRSIIVGCVLIIISLVSCVKGSSHVMRIAAIIHTAILVNKSHKPLKKSLLFHVVVAKDTA